MQTGFLSELFVSFQGEGVHAGRRHLFIRMAGCNLRCRYCDTPHSLDRVPSFRVHRAGGAGADHANPVRVADLIDCLDPLIAQEGPIDGVAVTGGEPLLQSSFLAELLAEGTLPHPRLLETNGMLPERLEAVLPYIDVVSMDIKIPSNTGEPEFWDAHARFLRLAHPKVYVKILVDSGTLPAEVARAAGLVQESAPGAPVFLQPITDTVGRVDVNQATLGGLYATARRSVADVRVLPQAHKMLGIQ